MTKKKSTSIRKIPDKNTLAFPRRINFTSPLPIEECEERIRELNEQRLPHGTSILPGIGIKTSLRPKNPNERFFGIMVDLGRYGESWIVGELSKIDDTSTLITATTGGDERLTFLAVVLCTPFCFICYSVIDNKVDSLPFLALFAILLLLMVFYSIWTTNKALVQALEKTLEKTQ